MRVRSGSPFTTVRVEGQILPPDLLSRISNNAPGIEGLRREDYHLSGETINEATSRSWNRLLGTWAAFRERRENLLQTEPETAMTRERWLLPLFRELDYGRLQTSRAVEIEGRSYPVSHAWENTPVHLTGYRADLDRRTSGRAGAARTSPHGLVQELLNRSDDYLWAFVSNGLRLRILRDNASFTRQAFIEFDLEAMMEGEAYPDFVLLWMLCHQSRVEVAEGQRPEDCWLEKWSQAAAEQGSRALDRLRDGVEEAIRTLGSGFLAHRDNADLRRRLTDGELNVQDYYRQLLRLVYRMLFLFVAEDRDLLLTPDSEERARDYYTSYYSTRRLRDLAGKRVGTRHADLYRQLSLVITMLGEDDGCPPLGLPALGGFLFDAGAAPDLTDADISNRDLLDAVRALSYLDHGSGPTPVDYSNLGAEELGSVYESLLERSPTFEDGTFGLETLSGNERKTTGSYYTPDSLVTNLLDTALDPVLDEAAKKPDAERAILALKVCDPAVGSGHFLIRAAHRIARRLAAVRTGDEEPAPEPYREALRDVIGRCLYGVDVNPMSAELCRFNLLLEGLAPGKPLSFLDGHIKVGNSLLGTTPDLISSGLPDDAFKPIQGDDKPTVSAYKRRNKTEREAWESGQTALDLRGYREEGEVIRRGYRDFEAAPDDTPQAVREKEARYREVEGSAEMAHRRLVADAWCAAFVWKKTKEVGRGEAPYPITTENILRLIADPNSLGRTAKREVESVARDYAFFHWHTAFPNVFGEEVEEPGFDVVLGNPPWERIKLQEQEWFAARSPDIANAPNAAARKRRIKALVEEDPDLSEAFYADLRKAEGASHLIRSSGRFPLCGRGDVNTYSVFAETKRDTISSTGRVGCIVPSGIATDNTTKDFFADLVNTKTLASLYEFENVGFFSAGQGHMVRFALLTLLGRNQRAEASEFLFQGQAISDLTDLERRFPLTSEDIRLLNPNTRTCPIFRSRRDAGVTRDIYSRVPVLIDESRKGEAGNPWGIKFSTMFHMSNDSGLFRTREELEDKGYTLSEPGNVFTKTGEKHRYLPIYESKMFFHYNHRYGDFALLPVGAKGHILPEVSDIKLKDAGYVTFPRYWGSEKEVEIKLGNQWECNWFLSFRDVTDARASARTVIFDVIPFSGVGNSAPLCFLPPNRIKKAPMLLACLSSFALDFVSRPKVGGLHLNFFIAKQLAVLPPETYDVPAAWGDGESLAAWISSRVLELTYTAHDLAPFARDLGYTGDPFAWDTERRFLLRCELDAAYFHLYGIVREDVEYIMDTFPIVKRKDEAAHGEYRTKRVILEIYDAMQSATETGNPYRTPLDPPPASIPSYENIPRPATVTSLRPPRQETPQPESQSPATLAADPPADYEAVPRKPQTPDTDRPEAKPRESSKLHREEAVPANGNRSEAPVPMPPPAAQPNLYEAALAIHACIPDGEKVPRDRLLIEAATELGHTKMTKKVRSILNKALNAEHNKGRLKTDWKVVWKPGKK